MAAGRKSWERTDMVEAESAVRREKRRMGEATVARGGNTSPSLTFLTFSGPNACHSDQAGTQTQASNSCAGLSICCSKADPHLDLQMLAQ